MSQQVRNILGELPPYKGDQRLVTRRQDTFDIIREILKKHKETMAHYDKICIQHWQGSPEATARHLYNFLKLHAPYRVEPTLKQTIKTPAAILEERLTFGNDCKHYASYIVGVGEALRRQGFPIKSFYRFASYNNKRTPGHVFGVFVCDGREIWIDPVPEIPGFNSRLVAPTFQTDKMPPMSKNGSRIGSLYDISGINNSATVSGPIQRRLLPHPDHKPRHGGHQHWLDHPAWGGPHQVHSRHNRDRDIDDGLIGKAKHKAKAPKAHHGLKLKAPKIKVKAPHLHIKIQPGKLALMVTLAPARGSFLILVKVNMFNMAVAMWEKAAHDTSSPAWAKLAAEWKKLGGKTNALMAAIKEGVKVHNALHSKHKVSGANDIYDFYSGQVQPSGLQRPTQGIGMAGALPAAIAAAAPIMLALKSLLSSFGVDTKQATDAGNKARADVATKHNKHKADTDSDGDTTHDDGTVTSVGIDPTTGDQSLMIKDVPGAASADAGFNVMTAGGTPGAGGPSSTPGTGGDDDEDGGDNGGGAPTKTMAKKAAAGGDEDEGDEDEGGPPAKQEGGFQAMLMSVESFITDHKTWFIVGGVIVAAAIILPAILGHKKKRRR